MEAGAVEELVVHDRDIRRALRSVVRVEIAHETPPVIREHAAPCIGIAKEEPAFGFPVGHVAERVGFGSVGQFQTRVQENRPVSLHVRCAPDLGVGLSDMGVAAGDQAGRIAPLHAADRRLGLAPLRAQIGETAGRDRGSDIRGEPVFVAVAFVGLSPLRLDHAAVRPVLEHEVDHPGDGVRAVLGGGGVAQHFHPVERDRRDHADVGALRAFRNAVAEPDYDGRAMAALAVDEHQRLIRREPAQVGGANEGRRVADRLGADVVGRHQRAHEVGQVRGAAIREVLAADQVDRRRRIRNRPDRPARAHDKNIPEFIYLLLGGILGPDIGRHRDGCQRARQNGSVERTNA